MFDLEQALAQWRRQMESAGINSGVLLDELENHLREDITQKLRAGAPSQEAFNNSVQGIGSVEALNREFKKIHRRSAALEKLMIGICSILVAFIVFLGSVAVWACFEGLIERAIATAAMVPS
jgi:hypothetical protein